MDDINYSNVIEKLLEALPEFRPIHDWMLEYDGEIIPYILIGSGLVKFMLKNYELYIKSGEQDVQSKDILTRLTDFLESAALSQDEDVVELIRIGFMEHLDVNWSGFSGFAALLKPASKQLLIEAKEL